MALEESEDLQKLVNELSEQLRQLQNQLNQIQRKLTTDKNETGQTVATQKTTANEYLHLKKYNDSLASHSSIENFIGLRIINLVGIVVLLIGISIGVKYAIDKNLITPFTRIALAYIASIGLFILSISLKRKYEAFSAILFSGAMASAYFTTYGSFAYYGFISETICFIIMAAIAIYTAIQSLKYNKQIIAILGMVGAYAIPLLISANHENFILLFCYILVMNLGILFLSFRRSWKVLNLLALIITWSFFVGWLLVKYQPAQKFYTQLFMFVYYVLFLLIELSFSTIKKFKLNDEQLFHILINDFALYLSLLLIYTTSSDAMAANVSIACAMFFLSVALIGTAAFPKEKMLNRMHYIEMLVLTVLFVSLEWSELTITMLWTLIAIVTFLFGIILKITWPRLAAIILIGITLIKLVFLDSMSFTAIQKIIAYITLGTLLLILSFFYQKFKQVLFRREEITENN